MVTGSETGPYGDRLTGAKGRGQFPVGGLDNQPLQGSCDQDLVATSQDHFGLLAVLAFFCH